MFSCVDLYHFQFKMIVFQIPLNPPLRKGEVSPPFGKGGLGGIYQAILPFQKHPSKLQTVLHHRWRLK